MTLTFGSLFSGIGGFDLGLERAGMTPAFQCEIDPAARRVLARHWPDVPIHEDVKESSGDRLTDVDVLCGGFPCQDLSVAGRRAGLAGERSGLFHEFMRLADELAPRWVLIENVPGLLSSNEGRDMGTVVGTLGELGYGWAYRILDAQYFGVAQRRRRVFIVGRAGDAARACQVLFEPESGAGHPPPSRQAGEGAAGAATDGAGVTGTLRSHMRPGSNSLSGTVAATLNSGVPELARCVTTGQRLDLDTEDFIAFYSSSGLAQTYHDNVSPPVTVAGGSHPPAVAYNPYRTLEKDGSITSDVASRPVVDALHGPTGNMEPLIAQPMAVRRLVPSECERLQGFPDGWTEGETDGARYRQLGNAICVPVAEWIGRRMAGAAS